MLTDRDLKELLNYSSPDPVLSVYLNTDAGKGSVEAQKLRLRNLLKETNLPEDEAAIVEYFEHAREATGRAVAFFSCVSRDFFRAYPLAVSVRDRVRVGKQPYIKPLADLLDAYGGYGIVLIDRQGARLFWFHLGEMKEQEGVLGEEVRQSKGNGASSLAGRRGGVAGHRRSTEEIVERNFKESAKFAARFFEDNHIRRILIGGTEKNITQFRQYLPKSWQSLIIGTFPMSMSAGVVDVLEKAVQIGQESEQKREQRLVNAAITAAAKGGEGVVRLDETLSMVHEGRVQTLIIQEGLREPGYRCQGCEYLTTQKLESCPFCGNTFERIDDAVEMAVRKVMQSDGDVEVVRGNKDLQKVGVAGLLRY